MLVGATNDYAGLVGDFAGRTGRNRATGTRLRRKNMRPMPSPFDDNELRLPGRRACVKSAVLTAASAMALPSRVHATFQLPFFNSKSQALSVSQFVNVLHAST
jgi:hypothetical protein